MKILIPFQALLLAAVAGIMAGCGSAKVTGTQNYSTAPVARPSVIYVNDFDLQPEDIQSEPGIAGNFRPLRPLRQRFLGNGDPNKTADKLVNLMSDSLVKDLTKAGFVARRLPPNEPYPSEGWVIRGVFTEVQEGNRLRRAIIGFGAGKTDLQVVTSIDNLAKGPPQPLYKIDTDATSGNSPGAAPFMIINPASAAVRFVITKGDLDRNTKKTASKIADQAVAQFKPAK
jgi:hypothetical protein